MAQSKNLADYEEEAFRNAVLIDGIHAQVKNITTLNKEALPIIYRLRNKHLEAFFSFKKYKMFQNAGKRKLAADCLANAEHALDEAKYSDKDLQDLLQTKGYHISR